MPMQFLDSVKTAILLSVAQANVSGGVAHNLCYQRNKVLSLHDQIRSLHKMSQCVVTSDESMNHVDDFIEQFKKKGVSFCCLYHHEEEDKTGQVKAQLVNEMNDLAPEDTPDSPPETECSSAKIQLDGIEHAEMSKFAVENRQLFDLVRQQELLLGLAYVYPTDKRVFKLFPRVLKIDCTSGTNDEKRSLLTITVMDQNGRWWIIFQALLPNERAWRFKLIFQDVLPNMLGMEFLVEVEVIITDRDSQETTQLDLAIKIYSPCHATTMWMTYH
jgi:hypothetical protein